MTNTIKSKDLSKEIQKAERSEGYLIMISRLNSGELKHTYFTQTFPREDISIALEEHRKLLKRETPPTSAGSKEIPEVEGQKTLPPEYRNK